METTERLVRTWMASGRDEEIGEIVTELSNDRTTLLNVIKALGEYLTSEEDDLRSKGVGLLSTLLGRCPTEKLNRQSVRVLTSFYCGKLEDIETIIPALKGLVTLTSLPTFPSSDATNVIQAIFAHVKMKAIVQSVRFNVFTIIDTLMARHRPALKAMDKEFLAGYLALAEGEKDPRNLLVAFAIARVVIIEFDITLHVESFFNITFCYFPITFRPPPNDPYGISTDDLRLALRGCMNATPAFGPLAVPVFLEKLVAGSPAIKLDTLQSMTACLPVYGSALARSSARKLWNSLKLEIFQPVDSKTEEEALRTLQTLITTIYSEEETAIETQADIQGLARDACEECIQILCEPEKSQAKYAIRILCAFMTTTPSVSRYTVSQAVPHLVKLFLSPDEIPNRPQILVLLADLVIAARTPASQEDQDKRDADSTDTAEVPLSPYKDEVLGVMTVGLKNAGSRRPALAGLKAMVTTKSLLSDEELGFIVHNVNEVLQADGDENGDATDDILDLLKTISSYAPRHVEEQTLPLLFSSLPDHAPARDAAADRVKYWRTLSSLRKLCVQAELFETLVIRLTTKLDLICVPLSEGTDSEPSAAYAHSILKTTADTLSVKVEKGDPDVPKYIDRLLPRLFNLFIYSAVLSSKRPMIATDPRSVTVAAQIIGLVVQTLPISRQEILTTALFDAFYNAKVKSLAEGHQKIPADCEFLPFRDTSSPEQKNLVALFAAAVVAFHKEVKIPVPVLNDYLDLMLSWSLDHAETDLQRQATWHTLASILNKRTDDATGFISAKLEHFWSQEIADSHKPVERRRLAIQAWIWISKALLAKNHPLAMRYTDRLFEAFGDKDINWDVAKAIGQIGAPDTVLTKRNHAVIKILHAQKFVNSILPRIIAGAKDTGKPQEQTAYLVALTSLIKSIPKAAYAHEMPTLIPLLLRGLDLPDTDIRAKVVDTFLAAAEGDIPEQSLVAEYAPTLVTSMLKNSMVQEIPSIRVRIAALRYLSILPSIVRYDVLHPYKATVIRELAKVLDDPRRSVRKEAVNARTIWFRYSG